MDVEDSSEHQPLVQDQEQPPEKCLSVSDYRWWLVGFLGFLGFVIVISIYLANEVTRPPVRGVILMISDGFGPASETFARNYYEYLHQNVKVGPTLPLDSILVGSSRTKSSSSFVTDSAAGATAFSCGIKTYNGAIGVDPKQKPCGTVLEAAKEKGYLTGLVATSRITHATPAAFAAHVSTRADESEIALQELGNYTLGRRVDLMFGGGKCHFLSSATPGSCRLDQQDPLKVANHYGWNVSFNRDIFDSKEIPQLPFMNLFALDHMNYEIDRPKSEPSLAQMSKRALDILNAHSLDQDTSFFLMIEGSRIDMAAHSNDAATHAREIFAYNEAIEVVKDFVGKYNDLVMISVSDHETGGLTVGRQLNATYPTYEWKPQALVDVKHSSEFIATSILDYNGPSLSNYISNTVFHDWLNRTATKDQIKYLSSKPSFLDITYFISDIIAKEAMIGFTTHGHTAVDVNLYAYGKHASYLAGNRENTEIGKFIVKSLELDLESITDKLLKDSPVNIKEVVSHDKILHYHSN